MIIILKKSFAKWEKIKGQKDFTKISVIKDKLNRKREDYISSGIK
jgi:hypothetical protein